ncbi:hypothetical protein [Nocardia neocaledoniensis]|uniref:hypothetical protein n=1 Tax=Nocardia neocaledoniensis TaxID=236511 RepID=UPI002457CC6A|nr:hypothetical protein [Nocardia neocaledoniensis]
MATQGVAVLALLALAVLLAWACGSIVARLLGALIAIDSLLGLSTAIVRPALLLPSLMWFVVGAGLWLVGHRIYLAKYGRFRTDLAARSWNLPGLRSLLPMRARTQQLV